MIQLAIDGNKRTGHYLVSCECGDLWDGRAEPINKWEFNPAGPIAECIVHVKLLHPEGTPELRFSIEFSAWLKQYWERWSERVVQAGGVRPAAAHQTRFR